MELTNYHLHTNKGSHGHLSSKEVIKKSIEDGIKYICFTDHYPLPNHIKKEDDSNFCSDEYYEELKKLKKEYKNKINISIGVEIDWIEELEDYLRNEINKRNYDFVIGAIHLMKDKGGTQYLQPHAKNKLIENHNGIKNFITEYYRQIRLMIKSGMFDSIGHLDRIKWNNQAYFSEEDDWYKDEIIKCLDIAKKQDNCIEVNTCGLFHFGIEEQYPNRWILEEIKKRNIPITIGTDGHDFVNDGLKEGYKTLKEIGFTHVCIYQNRVRKKIPL